MNAITPITAAITGEVLGPLVPSLFDFKDHPVRVVEIAGNPWFAAADVCKALDLGNPAMSTANISSADVKRSPIVGQRGRPMVLVSEPGLYKLVMDSRKPEAEAFKAWVTGTVLPAIRKDGGYIMGEEKMATGEMDEETLLLKALQIMDRKLGRLTAERDEAFMQRDGVAKIAAGMIGERAELTYAEFAAEYFRRTNDRLPSVMRSQLTRQALDIASHKGIEVRKTAAGGTYRDSKGTLRSAGRVYIYPREVLIQAARELDLFRGKRDFPRALPKLPKFD